VGLEDNEALNEHGPLGKRIFSVLFLVLFVATLGLGIVAPLMPVFAESLGATGIWLGVIFSGFSISRVIFMPLIGRLSDSRGRKKFITAGLLLYAVLSLLYPMAGSVYSLVAVRLIHGFASAMVFPIAMAYVADVSRRGNEGETMGTFNIAMFLGMGAGPLLGGALKDAFGFPAAFYSMSALTAVAFLITLFFLPDVVSSGARHRRHVPFRKMVESRTMKGILVFRMVSAMGRGSIMAFLPIIAARYDVTTTQIGVIISSLVFVTALLQRPFGKLADRFDRVVLVIVGSVIATLPLFFVPQMKGFVKLFILGGFVGLGSAVAMPSASAISVVVGQRIGMGATMGLFTSAMSVGMIVAPILSGIVMDMFGIGSVFYVSGTLSAVGVFFFYLLLSGEEMPGIRYSEDV